jgi:hypothetical protein
MAKQNSDVTPPAWAKSSTMTILSAGATSAKPPVAPSKSGGGLPMNKLGK